MQVIKSPVETGPRCSLKTPPYVRAWLCGLPVFVYLCMAESFVLIVSREGGMQVSSVCWVGVRIGLYSGRNMPEIRPMRPGAGEYQGSGS